MTDLLMIEPSEYERNLADAITEQIGDLGGLEPELVAGIIARRFAEHRAMMAIECAQQLELAHDEIDRLRVELADLKRQFVTPQKE